MPQGSAWERTLRQKRGVDICKTLFGRKPKILKIWSLQYERGDGAQSNQKGEGRLKREGHAQPDVLEGIQTGKRKGPESLLVKNP